MEVANRQGWKDLAEPEKPRLFRTSGRIARLRIRLQLGRQIHRPALELHHITAH